MEGRCAYREGGRVAVRDSDREEELVRVECLTELALEEGLIDTLEDGRVEFLDDGRMEEALEGGRTDALDAGLRPELGGFILTRFPRGQ